MKMGGFQKVGYSKDTCHMVPASDTELPTSRASRLAKHAQPLKFQENAINLSRAA